MRRFVPGGGTRSGFRDLSAGARNQPKGRGMTGLGMVLARGSAQMPTCLCGKQMRLSRIEPHPAAEDTEFRRYECASCDHEMRVMVCKDF
jgi:hypothetical protein